MGDTATLAMRLMLMGLLISAPAVPVPAAMILTDNGNNSQHGFGRVVTVSSSGQFNISFTATLQACGDNIVDLINDPSGTNPLNPEPPSWEGDPGSSPDSYVWRQSSIRRRRRTATTGILTRTWGRQSQGV